VSPVHVIVRGSVALSPVLIVVSRKRRAQRPKVPSPADIRLCRRRAPRLTLVA